METIKHQPYQEIPCQLNLASMLHSYCWHMYVMTLRGSAPEISAYLLQVSWWQQP